MIARVVLPVPVRKGFDFRIPDELVESILVGKRVQVMFRGRKQWGIVCGVAETSSYPGVLKDIISISSGASFSKEGFSLCRRIAKDYVAPLGIFVNRLLPSRVSHRKEQLFRLAGDVSIVTETIDRISKKAPRQVEILRFMLSHGISSKRRIYEKFGNVRSSLVRLEEKGIVQKLGGTTSLVSDGLKELCAEKGSSYRKVPPKGAALLFGRDRWKDYMKVTAQYLASGRQVLILTPEILLAHQLHEFARGELGQYGELYHSSLSEGARGRVWELAANGAARLVIGTRSAVFLPFQDLGVVIMDEEQDISYKQEAMLPYYHARYVAECVSRDELLLLGSSAPSVETFNKQRCGKLDLIKSSLAAPEQAIEVTIVPDTRKKADSVLSEELGKAIGSSLARDKRVLVGINRRGFFQAVVCKDCGHPLKCPKCGINITYNVEESQLICVVCGMAETHLGCERCGSEQLRFVGTGSARLEDVVRSTFPTAKVLRLDTDSIGSMDHDDVVKQLQSGEFDIIIGTPLIAKGPPIADLDLVGVMGIDARFAYPDFRADEKAFQYLDGLKGRLRCGRLIIQTQYPEHPVLSAIESGNYEAFYDREIGLRRELRYPPFGYLAKLVLSTGRDSEQALLSILRRFDVNVLGPTKSADASVATFLVKGQTREEVRSASVAAQEGLDDLRIDIDPYRF